MVEGFPGVEREGWALGGVKNGFLVDLMVMWFGKVRAVLEDKGAGGAGVCPQKRISSVISWLVVRWSLPYLTLQYLQPLHQT